MKTIELEHEKMTFFILNMFSHDSALHDFSGTKGSMAYERMLQVLPSIMSGGMETDDDTDDDPYYDPDDSQGSPGAPSSGSYEDESDAVAPETSGDLVFTSVPASTGGPAALEEGRKMAEEPALEEEVVVVDTEPAIEEQVKDQIINTLSDPNIQRLLFATENASCIMDERVFNPPQIPTVPPVYYYLHFKEGTYCAYDFTMEKEDTYMSNLYGVNRYIGIDRENKLINNVDGLPIGRPATPDNDEPAREILQNIPADTFSVISAYINTNTLLKIRNADVLIENVLLRPFYPVRNPDEIMNDVTQPMNVRCDAASQKINQYVINTFLNDPANITNENIDAIQLEIGNMIRTLGINVGNRTLEVGDLMANTILEQQEGDEIKYGGEPDNFEQQSSLIKIYDTHINYLDKYTNVLNGAMNDNIDIKNIYIRLAQTRDVLIDVREHKEEIIQNAEGSPFQTSIDKIIANVVQENTESDRIVTLINTKLTDNLYINIPATLREIGVILPDERLEATRSERTITKNVEENILPDTLLLAYYRCVLKSMRYNDLVASLKKDADTTGVEAEVSQALRDLVSSSMDEDAQDTFTSAPPINIRSNASTAMEEDARPPAATKRPMKNSDDENVKRPKSGGAAKFNSKFLYIGSVSKNKRLKRMSFFTYITNFTTSSKMPYSARKVLTNKYNPVQSPGIGSSPGVVPVFDINNLYDFYISDAELTQPGLNMRQRLNDYNGFPISDFNADLAKNLSKNAFVDLPSTQEAAPSSQYNKYDVLHLFSLIISVVCGNDIETDITSTQIRVPGDIPNLHPLATKMREASKKQSTSGDPNILLDGINTNPSPEVVYELLIQYIGAYNKVNPFTGDPTAIIHALAVWLKNNPLTDIVKTDKERTDSYGIIVNFQEGFFYMLETIYFVSNFMKELQKTSNNPGGRSILEQYRGENDINIDIDINRRAAFIFFQLVCRCCKEYADLADIAFKIQTTKASETLTALEKTAAGYSLGCILRSVDTACAPFLATPTPLLKIEQTMINKILFKNSGIRTKMDAFSFGDNDTELYKGFIKYLENPSLAGNFQGKFKSVENGKKAPTLNIFDDLVVQWGNPILETMRNASTTGNADRFFINNSVNVKDEINELNYFCPISSIMDNMPQCNNVSSSMKDGVEYGVMDVLIQTLAGQSTLSYRVRVEPVTGGSPPRLNSANIYAYLQIGSDVIINLGNQPGTKTKIQPSDGSGWPEGNRESGIHCPLTQGNVNPLDAKTCLRNIFNVMNSGFIGHLKRSGYENLIDYLELIEAPSDNTGSLGELRDSYIDPDPVNTDPAERELRKAETDPKAMRRKILQVSFIKGLGDFLQEINGVTQDGGYVTPPNKSPPTAAIVPFNQYRLQLSNDRPSGVRAVLMLLYGERDIRQNIVAGYITHNKYSLAGRFTGGQGGGRRKRTSRKHIKKNRKTKKRNHKTKIKKTKQRAKKQKHTRR